MMLTEYHSDARQLLVQGHLQELHLRNVVNGEDISNVGQDLSTSVTKIEELVLQFHLEIQTDRQKILYLSDSIAEF